MQPLSCKWHVLWCQVKRLSYSHQTYLITPPMSCLTLRACRHNWMNWRRFIYGAFKSTVSVQAVIRRLRRASALTVIVRVGKHFSQTQMPSLKNTGIFPLSIGMFTNAPNSKCTLKDLGIETGLLPGCIIIFLISIQEQNPLLLYRYQATASR